MNRDTLLLAGLLLVGGAVLALSSTEPPGDPSEPSPGSPAQTAPPTEPAPPAPASVPEDTAAILRRLVQEQIVAKQNEDMEGVFRDMELPPRRQRQMRELFRQVFGRYELTHTLDEFKLLVVDQDVAVARIKQTIRGTTEVPFRDNTRDALQVFRRRGEGWKLYEQVILETELLDVPDTQPAPTTQPAPSTQPAGRPQQEQ